MLWSLYNIIIIYIWLQLARYIHVQALNIDYSKGTYVTNDYELTGVSHDPLIITLKSRRDIRVYIKQVIPGKSRWLACRTYTRWLCSGNNVLLSLCFLQSPALPMISATACSCYCNTTRRHGTVLAVHNYRLTYVIGRDYSSTADCRNIFK